MQRTKNGCERAAEDKRYLTQPELILKAERVGVEFAKVRHQLALECREVSGQIGTPRLRLNGNEFLLFRWLPSKFGEPLKQHHDSSFIKFQAFLATRLLSSSDVPPISERLRLLLSYSAAAPACSK